jgi:hypothetical protein
MLPTHQDQTDSIGLTASMDALLLLGDDETFSEDYIHVFNTIQALIDHRERLTKRIESLLKEQRLKGYF